MPTPNPPGRPKGKPNRRTRDFDAKWDALAKKWGDPLEALFRMLKQAKDPVVRLRCAELTLRYRFPVRQAIAVENDEPTEIVIRDTRRERTATVAAATHVATQDQEDEALLH